MDRTSALTAARELEGFRLSPAAPDVRGWRVLARDGAPSGRVTRLFVDVKARRVRYLEVTLDPDRSHAGSRERRGVLVPVGIVRRIDDSRSVLVQLSVDALRRAPRIPARPVTRDDESETLRAYGMPVPQGNSDQERYFGEHFDDTGLLTPPRDPAGPGRDLPARH